MRGASVEDLRAKLLKKDNTSDSPKTNGTSSSGQKVTIPDDLVQIQAFIRWENAGKPNYSPEEQLVSNSRFLANSQI